MVNRPLFNGKKLEITIDSESFDELLSTENDNAIQILNYSMKLDSNSKYFKFIRTPFKTEHELLDDIPFFRLQENYDEMIGPGFYHDISVLDIINNEENVISHWMVGLKRKDLEYVVKDLFGDLTKMDDIFSVVLHSYATGPNTVFVTTNKFLLKNRFLLDIIHEPVTIVDPEETIRIIDLFFQYMGKYIVKGIEWDKLSYYRNRFISKFSYFPLNNQELFIAFFDRFLFVMMSLDEISIQKYLELDNISLYNIYYHFNYFISLVNGLFDNLALIIQEKYNLTFQGMEHPNSVNLKPKKKNNEEINSFLKALKKENQELYNLIDYYKDFILLIHDMRNIIIHDKMLGMKYLSYDENLQISAVRLNDNFLSKLRACKYFTTQKSEVLGSWGIWKKDSSYFLDPSYFGSSIIITLIKFSVKIFELLSFENLENALKNKDPPLYNEIKVFKGDKKLFPNIS
ncbi:hypothetical protein [Methanobacterium petrolearium]|uniref:hypothetical protein n=1 Tax=Methanobacterium petrolearium TaxID=710190 RepID=UPI001AEB9AB7|nr:hypothetical protein [Methanobacterium petrolearium]MBP1945751.1 hypothetical protein [Methanobacterium petrolearium]BDZ71998.1 hypothetical protein GCM10025861_25150 [Methanobacterium petrolearium]